MVNGQTWRPPWVRNRLNALVACMMNWEFSLPRGRLHARRQRGRIDDEPLFRTTAVLPFLAESSLSESAEQLFGSRRSYCVWAGLRYSCKSATTSSIVIPGATADLPVLSPRHTARRVAWRERRRLAPSPAFERAPVVRPTAGAWAGLCDRRFRVERPVATPIPAFRGATAGSPGGLRRSLGSRDRSTYPSQRVQ